MEIVCETRIQYYGIFRFATIVKSSHRVAHRMFTVMETEIRKVVLQIGVSGYEYYTPTKTRFRTTQAADLLHDSL
jgi:hypothetical protein